MGSELKIFSLATGRLCVAGRQGSDGKNGDEMEGSRIRRGTPKKKTTWSSIDRNAVGAVGCLDGSATSLFCRGC